MCTSKVEITFRRHIRDVTGNAPRLACFIDLGASCRIVDSAHDHGDVGVVEDSGEEGLIDMLYSGWVRADAVGYFGV